MSNFHTPALLKEAISGLNVRPDGRYIDATIGGGGHAKSILDFGAKVLGIDQDEDAIKYVSKNLESKIKNSELVLEVGNFADISRIARENGFIPADGILLDLGFSSYQIDKSGRGFSFLRDEALDMRMSKTTSLTAYEIINNWSNDDLYNIFSKFGEEKNARAISDSIVFKRKLKPIKTTGALSEIVAGVVKSSGLVHPATRVFQALRIVVNSEIDNLREGLSGAYDVLGPNGRLAVISFHSLEDRVVKLFFSKLNLEGKARIINKKPIVASSEEVRSNRRVRSAKLRIIEKI